MGKTLLTMQRFVKPGPIGVGSLKNICALFIVAVFLVMPHQAYAYPVQTEFKPSQTAKFSVRNISGRGVKCVISAGATTFHARIVPGGSVGSFTAAKGITRNGVSVMCMEKDEFIASSKVWQLRRYESRPKRRDLRYGL